MLQMWQDTEEKSDLILSMTGQSRLKWFGHINE